MLTYEYRVLTTAKKLLSKGVTTTLEIKNECRAQYPAAKIYQADVSEIMDKLALEEIPNLAFRDNGQYREYYINTPAKAPVAQANVIPTSKNGMVKILKINAGKFFGITFIKKDGTERTLNGHMKSNNFMSDLGYLNIMTNKGDYKQVDPRKILEITINGNKYVAK